jgi:hypothetical protein
MNSVEFYAPAVGCDEAGKSSFSLLPLAPPAAAALDNVVHAKKSFSFPYST